MKGPEGGECGRDKKPQQDKDASLWIWVWVGLTKRANPSP